MHRDGHVSALAAQIAEDDTQTGQAAHSKGQINLKQK